MTQPLVRRVGAEFVGTLALVAVVVGSGIQAQRLTPDPGVQLLANALVSALGLGVLIALLGPVSGAHLNPVVTLTAWWTRWRAGETGPGPVELAGYAVAQLAGAIGGAVLADGMFGGPVLHFSRQVHDGAHLWLGEVVATAGLVLLVVGLGRIGREALAPLLVAAYIGAAIWFTSSGSFANPAATVGRAFTDSFTGIAPGSVLPFVLAQAAGAAVGLALVPLLFGGGPREPGAGSPSEASPAMRPEVDPGRRPAPRVRGQRPQLLGHLLRGRPPAVAVAEGHPLEMQQRRGPGQRVRRRWSDGRGGRGGRRLGAALRNESTALDCVSRSRAH